MIEGDYVKRREVNTRKNITGALDEKKDKLRSEILKHKRSI